MTTDLHAQIAEDIEAAQYREALRTIDREDLRDPLASVLRARAWMGLERFSDAHREVSGVLAMQIDNATRLTADQVKLKCLGLMATVEDALAAALALVDNALACESPADAVEANLAAAWHYARKQCRPLVDATLAKARELDQAAHEIDHLEGFILLMFDERLAAIAAYERARSAPGDDAKSARIRRSARCGLARVHYLLGDFAAAHRELDAISPLASSDIRTRRGRIEILAAEKRWGEVVAIYDEIAGISPRSDYGGSDAVERSRAIYRDGDYDEAVRALDRIVEQADDVRDDYVTEARQLSTLLSREAARDLPRRRLYAFPSVAQLRNHCGPASCELYLRFFGLRKDQVEIARAIKFPDSGTPVYRMRSYLEDAGFHTRRIEAELPILRALIDRDIPVILEEDYSSSRHVAVAIGYDDARGILEVQDPMTHIVRETSYEELAKIQAFSNAGALVAVPKDAPERLQRLDDAGARDCEYIALADRAWAALDEKKLEEADAYNERSLALRRDYELSWIYKFRRAMTAVEESPSGETRVQLHRIVAETMAIWPDDEWPLELAGEVAYFEDRYGEALQAYERARDRDPADPRNWSKIADCLLAMGNVEASKRSLLSTLARYPSQLRATENLAHVHSSEGEQTRALMLNEIARASNPTNAFNHSVHAEILSARRDFEGALAAYARVEELDPGRAAHALVTRARLLAKIGRFDEAEAMLRSAPPHHPLAADVPNELGFVLYRARAFERAAAHAKELADDGAMAPALAGAARVAMGDVEGGLADLVVALTRFPAFAWAHNKVGRALLARDEIVDAVAALSAAVTIVPSVAEYRFDLGDAFARSGSGSLASPQLRQAAESGDLNEEELVRVGAVLLEVEGARAVHAFFESLEQGDLPADLAIHRAHARTVFEPVWMPNAGSAVLRGIADVDDEDPFGRLQRGLDRFAESIEGEAEGEAMARAAIAEIATQVDVAFPRRLLASRMTSLGRYEDALELLAPLGDDFIDARSRVGAFAALERHDEAERAVEAFEKRFSEGNKPAPMGVPLRFQLAQSRGDHEGALALARRAGETEGESHDDGRLDEWELEEFDCLLALGRVDEAIAFGIGQAGDGSSLGKLAHHALLAGRLRVAASLAEKSLTLDPKEAYSLHALGRAAEVAGHLDEARALYARAGEADPGWHAWLEELSRLAMADGDYALALEHSERAINQDGHTCFFAVGVRAQVDLLAGDVERAKRLATRARGLGLSDRHHSAGQDIWGLEALLRGETSQARALFDSFLNESELASAADRQRIERVWEARSRLA